MIAIFMCTARSLFRTLESMATPCSVKAYADVRLPLRPMFDIAFCDIKEFISPRWSWNMKSEGKRFRLRFIEHHLLTVIEAPLTACAAQFD